ncbi:unnamed protein product, partial [Staurois parvus]
NIIQCKQTNHPQITVHTSKRRQAGRVNINRAGRYRGEQADIGRGHRQVQQVASSVSTEGQAEGWSGSQCQGSEQVAGSVVQRVMAEGWSDMQGIRNRIQGPREKNNTKAESASLA